MNDFFSFTRVPGETRTSNTQFIAGRGLERGPPEADELRPVRPDHRVDALQGQLVRGDDQQPQQVRREGHGVERGRPEDLHRLRGRGCHCRFGRRKQVIS